MLPRNYFLNTNYLDKIWKVKLYNIPHKFSVASEAKLKKMIWFPAIFNVWGEKQAEQNKSWLYIDC